jgi:hypothetical protein
VNPTQLDRSLTVRTEIHADSKTQVVQERVVRWRAEWAPQADDGGRSPGRGSRIIQFQCDMSARTGMACYSYFNSDSHPQSGLTHSNDSHIGFVIRVDRTSSSHTQAPSRAVSGLAGSLLMINSANW